MGSGSSTAGKEAFADASVDELTQACGLLTEEQRLKLNSAISTLAETVVTQGIASKVDEPTISISDEAKLEESSRAVTPSTAAPMSPKSDPLFEESVHVSSEPQPLGATQEAAVAQEVQASTLADAPMQADASDQPTLEQPPGPSQPEAPQKPDIEAGAQDETAAEASEKPAVEEPLPAQGKLLNDLPPENIQKAAFDSIDKNKSGYIEPDEFAAVLREMEVALTDEEIQMAFEVADADGDNRLDFSEYMAFLQRAFDTAA